MWCYKISNHPDGGLIIEKLERGKSYPMDKYKPACFMHSNIDKCLEFIKERLMDEGLNHTIRNTDGHDHDLR